MLQSEIVFFTAKIVLSGLAAFFAIIVWNRVREPAWMCIAAGTVLSYAGDVCTLLVELGIVARISSVRNTVTVETAVFSFLPTVFCIAGFFLIIIRSKRR